MVEAVMEVSTEGVGEVGLEGGDVINEWAEVVILAR